MTGGRVSESHAPFEGPLSGKWHRCKVWRFNEAKQEAIVMLTGQMCTLRVTNIGLAQEDGLLEHLQQSNIASPQYAKVRLGEWVPRTYSFSGSDFRL